MIPIRFLAAVAMLWSVVVLAGCSTSQASHSSPSNPPPTDAAGVAELLRRGVSSVSSTHFTLDLTAADMKVTAVGDEKLAGGKAEALDLNEDVGSVGRLRLVLVDQSIYVQPLAQLNQTGKPWVLVRPDSGIPAPWRRRWSNCATWPRSTSYQIHYCRAARHSRRQGINRWHSGHPLFHRRGRHQVPGQYAGPAADRRRSHDSSGAALHRW